jgi:hypothetical protein
MKLAALVIVLGACEAYMPASLLTSHARSGPVVQHADKYDAGAKVWGKSWDKFTSDSDFTLGGYDKHELSTIVASHQNSRRSELEDVQYEDIKTSFVHQDILQHQYEECVLGAGSSYDAYECAVDASQKKTAWHIRERVAWKNIWVSFQSFIRSVADPDAELEIKECLLEADGVDQRNACFA